MSGIIIRCRENGPLIVQGQVEIHDHEGCKFVLPADKPNVALCRCGASANKPFCDGAHKAQGFQASETAIESRDA